MLLTILGGGSGYDWHVDSVSGNDNNTGKSPAQAFATIAKLEEQTITAGQRIGLARGSVWREQMDISAADITIEAYGTGNRPILDAANVVAAGSWTKTGGQTNVYQATVTPEWGSANHLGFWEDGAYLTKATSLANCDATPASYFPSAASGEITLYVHPTGSSNPTSDGKVYEYSHRQHGLNSYDALRLTVRSVHTKHNLQNGGSLRLGQYAHAIDCHATSNGTYGVYMRTGSRLTNCTVTDVYNSGATSVLVHPNDNTPAGEGIIISGCTLGMSSQTIPSWGNSVGYTSHYNTSGDFGTARIENTTFTNLSYGINSPRHTSTIQIVNCTWTDCKFNLISPSEPPSSGSGFTVLVDGGSWISNVIDQRAFYADYTPSAITIQNLTLTTNQRTDIGYIAVRAAATVTVQDCNFINSFNQNGRTPIYCNNAGANLTLQRNTYSGAQNWTNLYSFTAGAAGMTWASDNNTFGPNFAMSILGTAYSVFATYQAAVTPRDANSTSV